MVELALARRDGCHHSPSAPRLMPEALQRRGHHLVRRTLQRLAKAYEIRRSPRFAVLWPELLAREPKRDQQQSELEDYAYRKSDRLEAEMLVCGVLFFHADLVSMKVYISPGVDRGIPERLIAKQAQISLRRTQRALRSLRAAGLVIFTEERRKSVHGCGRCRKTLAECKCASPDKCDFWVSDAAVRQLNRRIFAKVGADLGRAYAKFCNTVNRKGPRLPPRNQSIDLRVPVRSYNGNGAHLPLPHTPPVPPPVQPSSNQLQMDEINRLMQSGRTATEAIEEIRQRRRQQ